MKKGPLTQAQNANASSHQNFTLSVVTIRAQKRRRMEIVGKTVMAIPKFRMDELRVWFRSACSIMAAIFS